GDTLGVVSSRRGDDLVAGAETGHEVVGAPDLERAGALAVLGLQGDRSPRQPAQRAGTVDGRGPDDWGHPLPGITNVVQGDHRRRHRKPCAAPRRGRLPSPRARGTGEEVRKRASIALVAALAV